ncbi:hypothetical protein [Halorubrum lacusprofundi]|jgi:hypothetical protein|uniref:hypothetical protein n=1 Tax=Halorubrum lacusprofundi TaxID=2247 RepID=UPI001130D914|nr:hypothetical protein [Halorubrum lacusprofundi]MCG1008048.1 hypothetical protein [Halorubrum lacusprofundi]
MVEAPETGTILRINDGVKNAQVDFEVIDGGSWPVTIVKVNANHAVEREIREKDIGNYDVQ